MRLLGEAMGYAGGLIALTAPPLSSITGAAQPATFGKST
jgi:hypothetical protein